MRIAQLAPLWNSVPPQHYGGTERVVSYLTEELVRLGHEVTLFASCNSQTTARLHGVWPHPLTVSPGDFYDDALVNVLYLERVCASARDFDLIHSHLDVFGFPLARRCRIPVLTTLHGRLDLPRLQPLFQEFAEVPLVSLSFAQRRPVPWANWRATVYHGLPTSLYDFSPQAGSYLAYIGRLTYDKRPDHAIELAKRVGMPLRIAAKVDPVDRDYFQAAIQPLLSHPLIEYLGEITDAEKNGFLGNAYALVAPYDWPEPFGLVFAEALACGTPIIAYRRGSAPEVIEDGVTGFVCETLEEMEAVVHKVAFIRRARCREAFEQRFSVARMVQDYVRVYQGLLMGDEETLPPGAAGSERSGVAS